MNNQQGTKKINLAAVAAKKCLEKAKFEILDLFVNKGRGEFVNQEFFLNEALKIIFTKTQKFEIVKIILVTS